MNKSILIISPTPTHPPFAGNRSAILAYSKLLFKKGNTVSFLFVDTTNDSKEKEATRDYWKNNYYYFGTNGWLYRKYFFRKLLLYRYIFNNITHNYKVDNWFPNGLARYVRSLQKEKNFDAIIINYIWLTKIFKYIPNVRKILFTHDVFSNRFEKTKKSRFSVAQSEEARALNRCDIVLSIQEEESKYFRSITEKKVITTYSAIEYTGTKVCNNNNLLFLGGPNDYNTDGLVYFIKNILPSLKVEFPKLNLIVGGRICRRPEIQNFSPTIQLYGDVENLPEFFALSDIVINPVFEGTGLKIKNIEALSYQKIVICHPHNISGMFDESNAPLLSAESESDYIRLLNSFLSSESKIMEQKEIIKIYMQNYISKVSERFEEAIK